MEEQMCAVVQKDRTGLFTWFREKYEVSPFAEGVVAIYRGPFDEVTKKARDFEQENRGKPIRLLSDGEIADLLE